MLLRLAELFPELFVLLAPSAADLFPLGKEVAQRLAGAAPVIRGAQLMRFDDQFLFERSVGAPLLLALLEVLGTPLVEVLARGDEAGPERIVRLLAGGADLLPFFEEGLVGFAGDAPVGRFLDLLGTGDQRFLGELLGLDLLDQLGFQRAQPSEERIEIAERVGLSSACLELADASENTDLVLGSLGIRLDQIGVFAELSECCFELGDLILWIVVGRANDMPAVVFSRVLVNPALLVDEAKGEDFHRHDGLLSLGRSRIGFGRRDDRISGNQVGRGHRFAYRRLGFGHCGIIRGNFGVRRNRLRRFRQLDLDRLDVDFLDDNRWFLGFTGRHRSLDLRREGILLRNLGDSFLVDRFHLLFFDLVDHCFFHRAHTKPPMRRKSLAVFSICVIGDQQTTGQESRVWRPESPERTIRPCFPVLLHMTPGVWRSHAFQADSNTPR
ncbi:MAG: hypothetical protein R2848_05160 [Thermomicrobiales bacterium]